MNFATVWDFLKGKKTYILAVGAILTAFAGYLDGAMSMQDLLSAVFVALGFGTVRHSIEGTK